MTEVENSIRIMALGVAVGGMVASAIGLYRAPTRVVRWTGVIFCLCVAAYAIKSMHFGGMPRDGDGAGRLPLFLSLPLTMMTVSAVGWFWLFMRALFEDRCALHPLAFGPIALLMASGLVAMFTPRPVAMWFGAFCNFGGVGLSVYALATILNGWKSDLVEVRRRLRAPFLAVMGVYTILVTGMETANNFVQLPEWYLLVNAVTLAVISLCAAGFYLEARADLFGVGRPVIPAPPAIEPAGKLPASVAALDRAAQADLDRLEKLMGPGEIWREEGLTIASLALKVSVSETQLRRLINDHLGYRNFPSFVNARRIEAAKARLGDPNEARTSISTIAFDLGFGSLGPFNRAFREATGQAPSEWRRSALGGIDQPAAQAAAG
jgi:AraC-like DNA-binding protein